MRLIVEEAGSRRQVGRWLDQLAGRHQGRLLVLGVPFFSFKLSKIFIKTFKGFHQPLLGDGTRRAALGAGAIFLPSVRVHLQMMVLASR